MVAITANTGASSPTGIGAEAGTDSTVASARSVPVTLAIAAPLPGRVPRDRPHTAANKAVHRRGRVLGPRVGKGLVGREGQNGLTGG